MDKCKRIGFVDYLLDNFHANTYLAAFRNDLKSRGYTVAGCTSSRPREGRAWAKKNKVPYFDRLEELNEHVDYYMVLAPSNPEKHLKLCQGIFPFGKPTYVDKTFAPDLTIARKIFALADKYKVPVQTSSALRYTNIQAYVNETGRKNVRHMVAWGSGRSFAEYAIHPVELVISCMGPNAERLMRRGRGKHSQLLIDFSGGRTAVVNVYVNTATPFAAGIATASETKYFEVNAEVLFIDTASGILDFFDTGKPNIDRKESLMIRRILDAASDAKSLNKFVRL